MKSKIILLLTLFNIWGYSLLAQNSSTNSGGAVNQIQPSIIVIPFKTKGQNYRQLLEDPNTGFQKRIAISRVKMPLIQEGLLRMTF